MNSLTTKTYVQLRKVDRTRALHPISEENENEEVKQAAPIQHQEMEEKKLVEESRPNTNIMAIDFGVLEQNKNMATGDPMRCQKCLSFLNKYSTADKTTKTWVCEFCGFPNILNIVDEELPKEDIITYINPEQDEVQNSNIPGENPGATIIFCIDISGSMSQQQEYKGSSNKYIKRPGFITRLECVKFAIDEQLRKLIQDSPDVKVGFVLFGTSVTVLGDGITSDYNLQADSGNYRGIFDEALNLGQTYVTKPLKDVLQHLLMQLQIMETNGTTALGPGLLASVAIISARGLPGSKVILCTDGQANVGIGEVGGHNGDASTTYNQIGDAALEKGIVISLISLVEEECRLDQLAPCSMKTGGNIVKIDPRNLAADISDFLAEKIIAFDATLAIKLHISMKFVSSSLKNVGPDPTVLVHKLGNVTAATTFTFEYIVKSQTELNQEKIEISKLNSVPFQALINYIGPDNVKYFKVISKMQDVTHDRSEAEKNVNVDVLSAHSLQTTARLAMQGEIRQAGAITQHYRSLVKANKEDEAKYNKSVEHIANSVQNEAKTIAYSAGHRSDNLITSIMKTQKFIPKSKRSPSGQSPNP